MLGEVDVVAAEDAVEDVEGDVESAPTAADFKTAMTDSSRDPAGPEPADGVFGVRGALTGAGMVGFAAEAPFNVAEMEEMALFSVEERVD